MRYALGIDIGGTNVKAGLFGEEGELLAQTSIPTAQVAGASRGSGVVGARVVAAGRQDGGAPVAGAHGAPGPGAPDAPGPGAPDISFEVLAGALGRLLAGCGARPEDVAGVGLDVPGPVDAAGNVGVLPNVALDVDALRLRLRAAFPDARLAFANDVNAAALGELWRGSHGGRGELRSFMLVAIGTGVGAGLVVDGRLVPGAFGAAGEIGHLTVNRDEREACGCGRCGCLEQYASARGIVRSYLRECATLGVRPVRLEGPADTVAVFERHRAGCPAARTAVSLMCGYLGFALAQVSVVADPACYLIGGGVGAGFDLFADELRAAFRACCLPASRAALIERASLGNDAALYGSAYLALR